MYIMLRLNRIHRNNFLSACFLRAGVSIGISACTVFDTREVTQESETTSDTSDTSFQTESSGFESSETQKTDSSESQIPTTEDSEKKEFSDLYQETASLLFQTHERTDSIDLKLTRGVLSQQEMNHLSYEIYQDWDETMNQLLESLKQLLPAKEYEDLLSAQENWSEQRKASMEEAGKEAEGGSLQPLLENSAGFSLTRARCYELARNFGPDFTFELIKTYGLTDHTSDLGFLPEENSVTEEEDCYIVTYRLTKPVQIPSVWMKPITSGKLSPITERFSSEKTAMNTTFICPTKLTKPSRSIAEAMTGLTAFFIPENSKSERTPSIAWLSLTKRKPSQRRC